MKLLEQRRLRGYRQEELADRLNITSPLLSYIERGLALPIPAVLEQIEIALNCNRLDIYSKKELRLLKRIRRLEKELDLYHIHVALPRKFKKLLTAKNFKKAGYNSMHNWFLYKVKDFARQLGHIDDYFEDKKKGIIITADVIPSAEGPEQRIPASNILHEK